SAMPASLGLIVPPSAISNNPARDPRWTAGTGWTLDTKGFGAAGCFVSSTSAGDLLLDVPAEVGPTDSYDVYYIGNGGSPAFSVNATGRGSAATITPGALNGI